jgi:hypothetical protein
MIPRPAPPHRSRARCAIGARASLWLPLLLLAHAATAAPGPPQAPMNRVILLQPSPMSATARRCVTRIREELVAGGFNVTPADFGAGVDPLWVVDPKDASDGSLATIALVGDPDAGAAELWIVDRVAGRRSVVRRIVVPIGEGSHGDEVVAIRALEFLRASAIELGNANAVVNAAADRTTAAGAAAPAGIDSAEQVDPAALAEARGVFSLELGVSLLDSVGGVGAALVPLARLRVELPSRLTARLTLAGLGSRPRIDDLVGHASVGQNLGLFEVGAVFRRGSRLRPSISVGGGALLVTVDGEGNWPYEGRDGHRWAGLLDAGLGVAVSTDSPWGVAFEVHGMVAAPYPTLRFSDASSARVGRPSLLASLTLVALP